MVPKPDVPPEAALIRQRREDRLPDPPLSVRAAANAVTAHGVKMSEAGWRSIEAGRYEAKPEILTAMAKVVGVTPAELAEVGSKQKRENARQAAVMLSAYLKERAANEPGLAKMDPRTPEHVLQMLLEGIDDIRLAEGLTDDQKRSLENSLIETVSQTIAGQLVQIRTTLQIAREKGR